MGLCPYGTEKPLEIGNFKTVLESSIIKQLTHPTHPHPPKIFCHPPLHTQNNALYTLTHPHLL